MLAGSALFFAADSAEAGSAKAESVRKPLGKLTCEYFLGIADAIKPQYVIAAVGGKAKNAVIDVVDEV